MGSDSETAIYRKWFDAYAEDSAIFKHCKNIIAVLKEDIASGVVKPMEAKAIRAFFRGFCTRNKLKMEDFK